MKEGTTARTGEQEGESERSRNPGKAKPMIRWYRIWVSFAGHHRANLARPAIICQSAAGQAQWANAERQRFFMIDLRRTLIGALALSRSL